MPVPRSKEGKNRSGYFKMIVMTILPCRLHAGFLTLIRLIFQIRFHSAQPASFLQGISDTELKDHWEIISSRDISAGGETISTSEFQPSGCHRATVPGSILGSLAADSVYPDIFWP